VQPENGKVNMGLELKDPLKYISPIAGWVEARQEE
jgi:hypothetical protein